MAVNFKTSLAHQTNSINSSWTASFAVPNWSGSPTVAGDGIVIVVTKRHGEGTISLTDDRFTLAHSSDHGNIYTGQLGGDLSSFEVSYSGFSTSDGLPYSCVLRAVYGNQITAAPFATLDTDSIPPYTPDPGTPASRGGVILAACAAPVPEPGGEWEPGDWNAPAGFTYRRSYAATVSGADHIYTTWGGIADTASAAPAAAPWSWENTGGHVGASSVLLGLDEPSAAPILRVHPRHDGRGLSSARRVWPPSKTVQDRRWLPFGGGYR